MVFFKCVVQTGGTLCVKGEARLDAGALFGASQQHLAQVTASELGGAWAGSSARTFVSTAFKK